MASVVDGDAAVIATKDKLKGMLDGLSEFEV
jgi:hypothetical protein